MSAEKNASILLEEEVDDFGAISQSPDKSYHRTTKHQSFEIMEPKNLELDPKYHGSNNVTQYFGSEVGLFSKFTGMRNVSEEHRPHGSPTKDQMKEEEERESLTLSEKNKQGSGRIVSQGIENNTKSNNLSYKLAILMVIFSIQFGNTLIMIFLLNIIYSKFSRNGIYYSIFHQACPQRLGGHYILDGPSHHNNSIDPLSKRNGKTYHLPASRPNRIHDRIANRMLPIRIY